MLKIAICDDDADHRRKISTAAKQYFSAHPEYELQIDEYSESLSFLDHLDITGGCDIALLDICMPGLLGTDVAKEIRRRHDKTEIIFFTSSDAFAVDAFALKAAHYLLKPFTQKQFSEAMDRAMSNYRGDMPKYIPIRAESGEMHNVDINDIWYIESCGHTVTVYAKAMSLSESRRSLARLQEELQALSPGQFVVPYKGYIVNQQAINGIERDGIFLRNGVQIPVRKRDFKLLLNQYLDYVFQKTQPKM